MGIDPDQYRHRPVIGIAHSYSELNNCNMNLCDFDFLRPRTDDAFKFINPLVGQS